MMDGAPVLMKGGGMGAVKRGGAPVFQSCPLDDLIGKVGEEIGTSFRDKLSVLCAWIMKVKVTTMHTIILITQHCIL